MAHPFMFEGNPESGNFAATWSEGASDDQNKTSTVHYSLLARKKVAPYSGAYAWKIDLAGGTNNSYVQENTLFDISANGSYGLAFALRVASDLTMAASDRFTVFKLSGAAAAIQAAVCIRSNSGAIEILGSKNDSNSTVRAHNLALDKWHWVELWGTWDSANASTINFALDGIQSGTAISSQNMIPVTDAELGALGIDAGTTAGTMYFGPVIFDDARVGFWYPRYPRQRTVTRSQHVFVGSGCIGSAALLSTGNNDTMILYDTDTANTASEYQVVELNNAKQTSIDGPVYFQRGCYAVVSGNNATDYARGQVFVTKGDEGLHHPFVETLTYSDPAVITYGLSRKERPGNI